ncbi:hypothetical protein ACQJBY_059263 [Aegilops geniculata]
MDISQQSLDDQATASDLYKAFGWLSRLALLYRRCYYVALPSTIQIVFARPNLPLPSHAYAGTIQYLCMSSCNRSILPTATERECGRHGYPRSRFSFCTSTFWLLCIFQICNFI